MAEKVNDTKKKLKAFLKRGGRPGAKADFDKIIKKATMPIDK